MVSRVDITWAMLLLSRSTEMGFTRKRSAPLSMLCSWLASSEEEVRKITGIWLVTGLCLMRRQSSRPSTPGIRRSVTTTSGWEVDISAQASSAPGKVLTL